MYIGDNLRVGVRPEPGTNTAPTKVITSGTSFKILQKTADYVRIRTEDGTEGWIRDDYVSDTLPAKARLNDVEKELHKKQSELKAAQQELAIITNNNKTLNQQIQTLNTEISNLHQRMTALRPDRSKVWGYIIVAAISLCGLTFILGILWNKQQVAKKLGGHSL